MNRDTATSAASERRILHVDMDAFFASVELLRHPELRGQPVIVGGSGERGVVAAASYEARSFGVHSAMPSVRARRLCPHAVFLAGDHAHYRAVSERIMAIFQRWTPLVEPLSLDEAFLDVSGTRRNHPDPVEVALTLRSQVLAETGLYCSIGIARNKFLAKIATSEAKPRATRTGPERGSGVFHLEPAAELDHLGALPLARLWGVGPATLQRLAPLGLRTVGELRDLNPTLLAQVLGPGPAARLLQLAHGIDDRAVEPDAEPRSISQEETFARDIVDRAELRVQLVRQADSVAGRLRARGLRARTITLKLRYGSFETLTRSRTLSAATDSGSAILAVVAALLDDLDIDPGVRLIGVGAAGLETGPPTEQLTLDGLCDGGTPPRPWSRADQVVDRIRARFGEASIGPASQAGSQRTRGDQQWGPNAEPDR